jgi:hypothetical protein
MEWWVAALAGALVLYLAALVLTVWLARHVWKRRKRVSLPTKALCGLLVAAVTLGPIGGVLGLSKGLMALAGESADPSQKARVLADGLAEFINCSAFAIIIWLPTFIAAFTLLRRSRRATRVG